MASEVKPWRYEIKYGPEGEDAYSWVYDDHGAMVATMKTHKAKQIVDAMNTRPAPAATDTGLVTLAKQWKVTAKNWSGLKPEISEPFDERELVTRSQAEAIIAAKNATLQDAIECVKVLTEEKNKLEADNAALIHDLNRIKDHETELVNDNTALTARIKELDRCHEGTIDLCNQKTAQIEALEAKLAAAEKALEPFVSFFNEAMKGFTEGYAERTPSDKPVLGWNNAYLLMRHFIEARAVLGGKP